MTKTVCVESRLEFDDAELTRELFGPENGNLQLLEQLSGVELQTSGTRLILQGGEERNRTRAANLLVQLYGLLKSGKPVFRDDVKYAWSLLSKEAGADLKQSFQNDVFIVSPKKTVTPRSVNQKDFIRLMRTRDMVFAVGPAGTGKTYLAVAAAVSSLMKRKVKRLILTRPAVEAGERLGFLPGDMVEKVNPYLRPLYDALHDMLDSRKVAEMLETGVIEIAPLAFMRGRTLNDAFVILDEAQNTTPEQMKMFLTRLGHGSKMVITGDVTQIDLPAGRNDQEDTRSGLVRALEILKDVKPIEFLFFDEQDVVRHPLVAEIVNAYGQYEKTR